MRAFMGAGEWEGLDECIENCLLLPSEGPRYGIPEDVLWLLNAFTLHIKEPERLRHEQRAVLGLIKRGAELEDVWPEYAPHLLNVYNDQYVAWCQQHKIYIPEQNWAMITELCQIAKDRDQLFRPYDHRHTLGRIKMTTGKQPFWRAFYEAIMENRPANPYLAVCAFRNDPVTKMQGWGLAETLFRSSLTLVSERTLPKKDIFLVAGRRPIKLRNLT